MAYNWRRRNRRTEPIKLAGLHAVTYQLSKVTADYQSLLSPQENATMTNPNPGQAGLDADVAQLTTDIGTLVALFPKIQGALATLPQGVDISALDALVKQGNDVAAKYGNLESAPPAPAPTPDPTPTPAPSPTPDPGPTPPAPGPVTP